eukprot:11168282-Lingulodinium_polyedra.AAC.1
MPNRCSAGCTATSWSSAPASPSVHLAWWNGTPNRGQTRPTSRIHLRTAAPGRRPSRCPNAQA